MTKVSRKEKAIHKGYSVLSVRSTLDAVMIARRIHLFPYRTQKLSSLALMILGGRLPGKVGRCRLFWSYGQAVKTPPFHGGNPGSIPGRITKQTRFSIWESGFSLMGSFVPVSANMDFGAYLKNQYHAPVVELADTLDLGSSARAWGFKSLQAHQSKRPQGLFLFMIKARRKNNLKYKLVYPLGYFAYSGKASER